MALRLSQVCVEKDPEKIEQMKAYPFTDHFTVWLDGTAYEYGKFTLKKNELKNYSWIYQNGDVLLSGHRMYAYRDGELHFQGLLPFTIRYYYDFCCKKSLQDLAKYKEKYRAIEDGVVTNGCDLIGLKRLRYCNRAMDYTMPFALLAPKKPDAGEKLPLVVYLHGKGVGGETNFRPIVGEAFRVLAQVKKGRCIAVVPSIPRQSGYPTDLSETFPLVGKKGFDGIFSGLLDWLKEAYPIDDTRIYLIGTSNGACGVFSQIYLHPERYAAGIAMMGGAHIRDDLFEKLKHTPVWLVHSEDDPNVPIGQKDTFGGSDILYDGLQKVGNNNVRYTRYRKYGHRAFRFFLRKEKNWCDWLFRQKKNPE